MISIGALPSVVQLTRIGLFEQSVQSCRGCDLLA